MDELSIIKKQNNIEDLILDNDILYALSIVKKWHELKPNNKEIEKLKDVIVEISFLINSLRVKIATQEIATTSYKNEKFGLLKKYEELEPKYKQEYKRLKEELNICNKKRKYNL